MKVMSVSTDFATIYAEEVYSIASPVTIVISVPWSQITEDHRQLLQKILQAVRHSLDSVRIIHQNKFDASAWNEKPSKVVAFIEPPKGLTAYEVIQTGETDVVFSDPLAQLISDDTSKRKLWGALKSLFQA